MMMKLLNITRVQLCCRKNEVVIIKNLTNFQKIKFSYQLKKKNTRMPFLATMLQVKTWNQKNRV